MSNQIFWIVETTIKAGKYDALTALMREMVSATQANEPGALNYEWFISEDNTRCYIHERYADSAAAMTHIKNFGQYFAQRFMATVEVTRLMAYGNPTDEVKEALRGLGGVFMATFGGFARTVPDTEYNKEVVRRWNEVVINGRKPELIDEVLAENYRAYQQGWDREGMRRAFDEYLPKHPTLNIQIADMIAEGDKVAIRLADTEEGRKPWFSLTFYRLADGKIVDDWHAWEAEKEQ